MISSELNRLNSLLMLEKVGERSEKVLSRASKLPLIWEAMESEVSLDSCELEVRLAAASIASLVSCSRLVTKESDAEKRVGSLSLMNVSRALSACDVKFMASISEGSSDLRYSATCRERAVAEAVICVSVSSEMESKLFLSDISSSFLPLRIEAISELIFSEVSSRESYRDLTLDLRFSTEEKNSVCLSSVACSASEMLSILLTPSGRESFMELLVFMEACMLSLLKMLLEARELSLSSVGLSYEVPEREFLNSMIAMEASEKEEARELTEVIEELRAL